MITIKKYKVMVSVITFGFTLGFPLSTFEYTGDIYNTKDEAEIELELAKHDNNVYDAWIKEIEII